MRTNTFTTEPIISLLRQQTIATLSEITHALGNPSHRTVCRKIAEAKCRSSYSHRGSYYTLDELASYDANGLWQYGEVRFSQSGTLIETLQTLITESIGGYFPAELKELLGVAPHTALAQLIETGSLQRIQVNQSFLYCAADETGCGRQMRQRGVIQSGATYDWSASTTFDAHLSQAAATFLSVLDERQRRLFAGLESLRHGHGGTGLVASVLGMSPTTVVAGRRQLLSGSIAPDQVRKPGGGRKTVEKKTSDSSG